jgi:hypothetical protein
VGGLTAGASPLGRDVVASRLATMRNSVGQLDAAGPLDRARLARDPASGLVVERLLALLADLGFEINRQAADLAPPDGPHHLLVQQYLDTEPDRVAGVVSDAVAAYQEYVRQVTAWLSLTGGTA